MCIMNLHVQKIIKSQPRMVNIIDSIKIFNHQYSVNVRGYKHDFVCYAYYSDDSLQHYS